ncbi:hypothetical protein [Hydrogenophaga sp. OTU3427]|uniref:hypothetical protein n=1 Tax=Hydrogenophaga sp. OTU3427 TaxID=3043856 RepID=UPI00313BBD25
MQVRPEEENDFNIWFDQEHLPERVAIPGFLDARRYESVASPVRYLQIYNAVDFETLNGAPYQAALANQTDWSHHHISRFIEPTRVVGRLVLSRGRARGAAVVLVRVRPRDGAQMLPSLQAYLALLDKPGVTSLHFVEGDAELSKPVMGDGPYVGSGDAYVIIECTGLSVAEAVVQQLEPPPSAYGECVDAAVYRFRLDLNAASLAMG